MNTRKLKGNLLLLLAAFVWGLSFIAQSKGVELVSPVAFIGVRTMLGALVLLPVILIVDGNKRIGVFVMLITLKLNKAELKYTQDELISLGLAVASGETDYDEIYKWIIGHKIP